MNTIQNQEIFTDLNTTESDEINGGRSIVSSTFKRGTRVIFFRKNGVLRVIYQYPY